MPQKYCIFKYRHFVGLQITEIVSFSLYPCGTRTQPAHPIVGRGGCAKKKNRVPVQSCLANCGPVLAILRWYYFL